MKQVSPCCLSEIVQSTRREYPLGGTVWYESYIVDVCEKCGKEVEDPILVQECHTCGGSGFSGYGTGYNAVCDTCSGSGELKYA